MRKRTPGRRGMVAGDGTFWILVLRRVLALPVVKLLLLLVMVHRVAAVKLLLQLRVSSCHSCGLVEHRRVRVVRGVVQAAAQRVVSN